MTKGSISHNELAVTGATGTGPLPFSDENKPRNVLRLERGKLIVTSRKSPCSIAKLGEKLNEMPDKPPFGIE